MKNPTKVATNDGKTTQNQKITIATDSAIDVCPFHTKTNSIENVKPE